MGGNIYNNGNVQCNRMMSYKSNGEYVENETTSSNTMLRINKLRRIESASVKSKRNRQTTTLPDRNSPKREIMLNELEEDHESLSQSTKHSCPFSDILSDENTLYMYESFSENNVSSSSSTLDFTKSTVDVHSPYEHRDNMNATLNQFGREKTCVSDDINVTPGNKCENPPVSGNNHLDRFDKLNSKMCIDRSNTELSIKESDSKQKMFTPNPAINDIVRTNTNKQESNSIITNDVTTCIKPQLSTTIKLGDRGQTPDHPKHKTTTKSVYLKHSATGKTYGMNTLAFSSRNITNNQSLNKFFYKDDDVMKNYITRPKLEQIPCLDDVVLLKSSNVKSKNRSKKDKSKSGEFTYSNQYSGISNVVIGVKEKNGLKAINKQQTQHTQLTSNGSYNYNSKQKCILKGDICTSGIDNTSIFTPVDGKEVDKRRPKLEDKSVQTSVNKLEYLQFPRIYNPRNLKNESTRLIRGQSKRKRKSKEIQKELDDRFERQVVASIQKSKRGKKKSEILNEDGSIFRATLKKSKNKTVKTARKRKRKIASPVTAMEIQKLMAFSTHKKLFQQEYIPVKNCKNQFILNLDTIDINLIKN